MDLITREYLKHLLEDTIEDYEDAIEAIRANRENPWVGERLIRNNEDELLAFSSLLKELNKTGELKYEGKQ